MILSIVRTAFWNLRRDRGALTLSFVVPIAFFSIFAGIFGSRDRGMNPVQTAIVDEDRTVFSRRFVQALKSEPGLKVVTGPGAKAKVPPRSYDARSAEAAVRAGDVSVAIIIPRGFGDAPIQLEPGRTQARLRILNDSSDPIAAQVVYGLLQKAAMLSMPDAMALEGTQFLDQAAGGLTPEQRSRIDQQLAELREATDARARADSMRSAAGTASVDSTNAGALAGGLIAADIRDVVGESKKNPLVAFYAAGIGVMFLLFSASAAGGALLDEAESGTLDRILSSRVDMNTLLLGKLAYSALLGLTQLCVMFLWGALVFRVELFRHLGGFLVMAGSTALASAALGLVLATACKTRAQLGALTTLVVLVMSALGGSMVPRFIMPEFLQKLGLVTFNAWALDGFTKVFWREEPVSSVLPQIAVPLGAAAIFFAVSRRLARRWEST